jgi:maltooligosyltrehalose trehalohydrolase
MGLRAASVRHPLPIVTKESTHRFGPRSQNGEWEFRLWAPIRGDIALELDNDVAIPMPFNAEDCRKVLSRARPGARYQFHIGDGARVPDPAARAQDGDIGDPSLIVDPQAYHWGCDDWCGRPWEETILYELHVGLLGGFEGVAAQLERVARLGFTAVELMPVADFPGRRNWGYDGVLPFAPDCAYGTPDQLKLLVDHAHSLDLMVFLDVVYNHFGPDGNRIREYAPQFFRSDLQTPWGGAIDFREPMVRRFFIENAIYWLTEFRFDGLRLDAVHAIRDENFLLELAAEVRAGVAANRHVHLVVENDDNDSRVLRNGFDAQWNDDFHHALHVLLTRETAAYYSDYSDAPTRAMARALSEGFIYQGEFSQHRGAVRGTPSVDLPPTAFVSFLQNHDQIGNRAFGERLIVLADPQALRAAIALQLLCPQIPLVFMGEEAGAREPFLYFTDHNPELAEAVRKGRRQEFARFPEFADPRQRERIPDPNAPETFERSRPSFEGAHAVAWNHFYSKLLRLRREQIIPRLKGARAQGADMLGEGAVLARWRMGDGARLSLAINLGTEQVLGDFPDCAPVWGEIGPNLKVNSTVVWIES